MARDRRVYEATRVMYPEADLSDLRETVAGLKAIAKPRPKLPRMADQGALIELGEALIAHGAKRVQEGHMLSAAAVRDGCMILFQVTCPPCRRFVSGLATENARLGAGVVRYSFTAVDFHHLLPAGLPAHRHHNSVETLLPIARA